VYVPLSRIASKKYFQLATTEVFGPVQVVSDYSTAGLPKLLRILERMSHHLTAAVVSNNVEFTNKVLGQTVNGTTYAGRRARTTGAPQNHWSVGLERRGDVQHPP
jgi:1-pyrroline-5-carboxylate dehydrogenase